MSAKRERKVIPLETVGSDNVIEFPAPERKPLVRLHTIEVSDAEMKHTLRQFVILLENAARRVQLERQNKGG